MNTDRPTTAHPSAWTPEKVAWWVTFAVLTLSAVAMLGLWD